MSKDISSEDELNIGLYAILRHPVVYFLFEKLMGSNHKYKMYTDWFIATLRHIRMLDIGCGTGSILDFLPEHTDYVGYDSSAAYIDYAKKKYGHRAKFYNKRVSKMDLMSSDLFDVVLADGLLHHLNDGEAEQLFKIGYDALKPQGFMLTVDPVLTEEQNFVARLIASNDRGQHVRFPHEYETLARISFSQVENHIVENIGKRPQTGCIIKCTKD